MLPLGTLIVFIFVFGCCWGSFLNVVIYRLPREKSLISPPSACPSCGKHIHFYDNIPLFSWLILRGKCRNCKAHISFRYFLVELITGLVFLGVFLSIFVFEIRGFRFADKNLLTSFYEGGWLFYLLLIILLASLIAESGIDLELWVIPVVICWFVTGIGIIGSGVGDVIISRGALISKFPLPSASFNTAAIAFGASIGLIIALILLKLGIIKRSYDSEDQQEYDFDKPPHEQLQEDDEIYDHRKETLKEMVFLIPVIAGAFIWFWFIRKYQPNWWADFLYLPAVRGVLGAIFGYFIGCTVVWATRIIGTLAFNKEAMGLGDVHLMGSAGAIIGPFGVTIAFFIAPFFGLTWALAQLFFKKIHQIPYGPFLSMGVLTVIILYDWIWEYWLSMNQPY